MEVSMGMNILGHYFPYCQFCIHDGKCELKHHEFMGAPPGPGVSSKAYGGHEDLRWALSGFQEGTIRSTCTGRIRETSSEFYPLACECGTAISSFAFSNLCEKFRPNAKGEERLALAGKIAQERGIKPEDLTPDDLPPLDPEYRAAMER